MLQQASSDSRAHLGGLALTTGKAAVTGSPRRARALWLSGARSRARQDQSVEKQQSAEQGIIFSTATVDLTIQTGWMATKLRGRSTTDRPSFPSYPRIPAEMLLAWKCPRQAHCPSRPVQANLVGTILLAALQEESSASGRAGRPGMLSWPS